MNVSRTDSNHPNLRLRQPFAQPVACGQLIGVDLEFRRVNVDRNELAVVARQQPWTDGILVNLVAAPGEFLLCQTAFDRGHQVCPFGEHWIVEAAIPLYRELCLFRHEPKSVHHAGQATQERQENVEPKMHSEANNEKCRDRRQEDGKQNEHEFRHDRTPEMSGYGVRRRDWQSLLYHP